LYHDNAPAHDALAIREFLAKKSIMKLDHPLHSPDLALCDFGLFPKLKTTLKSHRFSDTADDHPAEEEFQKFFEQWKHRLTKCIGAQGD
jgi:hypothetical protein